MIKQSLWQLGMERKVLTANCGLTKSQVWIQPKVEQGAPYKCDFKTFAKTSLFPRHPSVHWYYTRNKKSNEDLHGAYFMSGSILFIYLSIYLYAMVIRYIQIYLIVSYIARRLYNIGATREVPFNYHNSLINVYDNSYFMNEATEAHS